MKYFLSWVLLTLISCKFLETGSTTKLFIKKKLETLSDVKAKIEEYDFAHDKLLKSIHDIGYDKFKKSASIKSFEKVDPTTFSTIAKQIMNDAGFTNDQGYFLKEDLDFTAYLGYFGGFWTYPESAKAKFWVVLSEKEIFLKGIPNLLVIDFTQTFELYKGNLWEKIEEYVPKFEHIVHGPIYKKGGIVESVSNEQGKILFQMLDVIMTETLKDYYGL